MDKMDKVQALESALKQIERDFGKGSIMKLYPPLAFKCS